jgi:hypothetical protein
VKRRIALLGLVGLSVSLLFSIPSARADEGEGARPYTVAVYGDWPYSTTLLSQAPLLASSVNSDPDVRAVLHVGDIHSGSMPCTGAGLNPLPAGSNPTWNQQVYDAFQLFSDPVIYTPGDNEWSDCHKKKEFFSGAPLNELAAVRSLFFARPGYTLGQHPIRVASQAKQHEHRSASQADSQFVENVLWSQAQVVFVTLNMPGSNNDTLPWTGVFADPAAQAKEVAERTAADLRWLEHAFAQAREEHAKAVVIQLQADMWDPAALVTGGDGLDQYTPFVQKLADLSVRFGRPVLLLNGDSHVYGSDQPLADPTSATGVIHHTQAVPNLTRITVEGAATANEWVKLTVNPRTPTVFSWERVQYLP